MKIIRLQQVCKVTGLSRTTLWRLERHGRFPRRIRLSRNSVGWDQAEVARWLAARPRGITPRDVNSPTNLSAKAEENLQ